MNRLEEIQELIKKFIYEKQETKQEITAIEEKRNVLAQERNNKINENYGEAYTEEVQARIFELGNQIKELGNQSQELQNKLDKKYINIKNEVANEINNNIASIMPGIKEKEEKKSVIQQYIEQKENRDARYIKQKEEFYKRFGRIPVLSENAMKENELQEEEYRKNKLLVEQLDNEIKVQEEEISKLVKIANDVRKGNWKEYIENNKEQENVSNSYKQEIIQSYTKKIAEEVINPIVESVVEQNTVSENKEEIEEDTIVLPYIAEKQDDSLEQVDVESVESHQEILTEEVKTIEEVKIEEIKPIEEINVEEIKPIEEINIEEINVEEIDFETFSDQEEEYQEEKTLEELLSEEEEKNQQEPMQNIEEQNVYHNIENSDNKIAEDIIEYDNEQEEKVTTYLGEKVNLLNINAKFEEGEVVYKAQISNGDCIKLYPRRAQTGNILLKDKENRVKLKEILINYAIAEYRMLDKKVIKKMDPSICEILIRFAKKYNYDAQNLIYNYAMSFSGNDESEIENVPAITYNFVHLKETNLDKKEKEIIFKICKNARKNSKIDIIGYNTWIKRIKNILKKTLTINDANALPEGKY